MKIWECKIGEVSHEVLAYLHGADIPMRKALSAAYREITGQEPNFIFSGWGSELSEPERAVVENREPSEEHYAQWMEDRRRRLPVRDLEPAAVPEPKPVSGGTMSEEQVLPPNGLKQELDAPNAMEMLRRAMMCLYLAADGSVVEDVRAKIDAVIDELLASLAQSEAERERLQGEVAEVIEKNRQFALTCLQMEALVDKACDAGERAEDELARERELHQDKEMEARRLMWITHGHFGIYGDDGEMQCSSCARYGCWDYKNSPWTEVVSAHNAAILERAALLEPQPAPVVTEEK